MELTKPPFCTIYNTMMTKKILNFFVLLGVSLIFMDISLWAGTAAVPPGADVQQEKTEKKEEEKKEEKKKKEEEKKVKRVWTDEDLKEIKKERLNITEVSPDPDEEKNKKKEKRKVTDPPDLVIDKTKGEKVNPKKTKKYWQERKKALVEKIQNIEKEIERLEIRIPELRSMLEGAHFNSPDRHSERVPLIKELEDSKKKLQNYKMGLTRLKQELEDFYDEARRAGALPGWYRD
ncbi:MAG: hypothetical protein PVH61_21125 [Candidatus Aminicenantes bacterium]